jgi:hypothetical protein
VSRARIAGLSAFFICLLVPNVAVAAQSPDADQDLEVVGGAAARVVSMQICPKVASGVAPAHTCTTTPGRPYRGGKVTILLHNPSDEEKAIELEYLPDGGTEAQILPGKSDRIFLVEGGTSASNFFRSLLDKATGRLKGKLLEKVAASLPVLARLATGRLGAAERLAKSPALAKLVGHALRVGVEELTPKEIHGLGRALEELISPAGREVDLNEAEVVSLLSDLSQALLPPGPQLAAEALKGIFETAAETVSESPLKVGAHKSLSVTIGFALPVSEAAATINGQLIVSSGEEAPISVSVSGEERSYKGVTVTPSSLSVDSPNGSAKLSLEGPELIEYLRSYGGEEATAILYGEGGETAAASVELPAAGEVEEAGTGAVNRAVATVDVSGSPAVGKYAGKLALPGLPADTGAATVELHQHRSPLCAALTFILMLLLVLLGILVTGVSTRIATMASRRKLLADVLTQTYDAFAYVLGRTGKDRNGERAIASWRLDDLLGDDPTEEGEPAPRGGRLQGLPALKESIATGRSSADLDEDAARVLDMVARMQRWLRVEPLARRLALVEAEVRPTGELPEEEGKDKDGKAEPVKPLAWSDSRTLRDTRALLEMAHREPADAAEADDLVARLMFQIGWHTRMAAAWEAAQSATRDPSRSLEVRKLEEALGEESKAGAREISEQDGLAARLEGLLKKHDDVEVASIGPIPGEEIDDEGCELGITPVEWRASSNFFTGWATLDGQSYGQLVRRTATSSRSDYVPSWDAVWREIGFGGGRSLGKADIGWTLAILVFAAVVYGVTTYDENWGSAKDFATAFLAGSLGKVTIDWAALPAFRSVRLRKAKEG